METVITTQEIDLDALQQGELTIRYGERAFIIPGSKAVDWILKQIVEMKKKQVAASLN